MRGSEQERTQRNPNPRGAVRGQDSPREIRIGGGMGGGRYLGFPGGRTAGEASGAVGEGGGGHAGVGVSPAAAG